MEKNKHQVGFIQISTLAVIILGMAIIGGFGYREYKNYQSEKFANDKLSQELAANQQRELGETKLELQKLKSENEEDRQKIGELEQKQKDEELKKAIENYQPLIPPIKTYKTSEIVAQNKKYIVYVWCQTSEGSVTGSGIVIGRANNSIVVLTNNHVTRYAKTPPAGVPPCVVDAGENGIYYAQPIYYPSIASQEEMALVDFSFLKVTEPIPSGNEIIYDPETGQFSEGGPSVPRTKLLSFNTFPEICPLSRLKIGEEIAVLGYPAIGGSEFLGIPTPGLTITEGIISSEVSSFNTYFVSSAKIEQGNSGGGAFLNSSGCLAGMPTFARVGVIESLGRLINLANLKEKYLKYIF